MGLAPSGNGENPGKPAIAKCLSQFFLSLSWGRNITAPTPLCKQISGPLPAFPANPAGRPTNQSIATLGDSGLA